MYVYEMRGRTKGISYVWDWMTRSFCLPKHVPDHVFVQVRAMSHMPESGCDHACDLRICLFLALLCALSRISIPVWSSL